MSKKDKKVCTILNYIEHLLILASAVTGCVSIFVFVSLVSIPIVIRSSAVELKNFVIAAEIKKYKSIIKKKKKKHDKKVLVAKTNLSTIEVLISRTLINSCISHDEFALVNNMLKEYDDKKEEIEHLNVSTVHQRF